MADRRVRYILEVDYAGESVVVRAADDLRQVDEAARAAGEGLTQAGDGFSRMQANIVTAQAALGVVQEGFAAVQNVARIAWETLSEGSALADARGDFADLAAEIGSTADVMQNELMAATGGLKTSAELIGESSELMGLGLGLTKEQIVDLSRVAAELELDMGALGDAINTGSSRALKEFGFNVQEVKARVAELREEGHSLNEAMAMAMIEAGEAKIERVGARSGEASGQVETLANVVEEVQNEFARGAAEGFADSLARIAGSAPEAQAQLGEMAHTLGEELPAGLEILRRYYQVVFPVLALGSVVRRELVDALSNEEEAAARVGAAYEYLVGQYEAAARAEEAAARATREQEAATLGSAMVAEYAEEAWAGVVEEQRVWAANAEWAVDSQRGMRDAVAEMNQEAANQEAQFSLAGQAAQAWGEYVGEVTARSGDYFTQITSSGRAQYDLNEAMYASADAHGAGAAALGDLGVELDLFPQRVADAGVAAAQTQTIVDNLGAAAAAGKIPWDEYATSVERALGILNNNDYLIDLGPRSAPEMEDRGFREGYQEDQQADTRDISPYAVVLEASNQAVLDAVEEARGVVEGFVNPGEVYQAVMEMDITAVEEKGAVVAGIIEDLPTRKTITIDIEIENQALLDQLRAIGAIP
jgi:hypothetical protein